MIDQFPLWVRERAAELCNAEAPHIPHDITGPAIIHDSPFGRAIMGKAAA